MDAVSIDKMTVGAGRLVCEVHLAPGVPRDTWPDLIRALLSGFPHLPQHACVNENGRLFGDAMDRTPLPHLLEHLAIDLQTRRCGRDDVMFVGTTDWIDEQEGTARIQMSFTDDLMALRSFQDAVKALNGLIVLP